MLDGFTLTDLDRELAAHESPDPQQSAQNSQAPNSNSVNVHTHSPHTDTDRCCQLPHTGGGDPTCSVDSTSAHATSAYPRAHVHTIETAAAESPAVTHPGSQASEPHLNQHRRSVVNQAPTAAISAGAPETVEIKLRHTNQPAVALGAKGADPSSQPPLPQPIHPTPNPRLRTPTNIDHPTSLHSVSSTRSSHSFSSASMVNRPATASSLRASCQLYSEGNSA